MHRLWHIVLLALIISCAHYGIRETRLQGGYATQLLERAVIEPARVVVEANLFNDWLNANYSSLTTESARRPRERLFFLIDSWVKTIYARDGVVFPKKPDPILQMLFWWSERLGAFGGHFIYNALRSEQFPYPEMPALLKVPEGFRVSLNQDLLVVSSEKGYWSVSVPYYFMIWNLTEWVAKDGPRTQLLALSTGAALHEGEGGYSQATLLLLFGPDGDSNRFTKYWSAHLGFTGDEETVPLPILSLRSRTRFDQSMNMYHEYTSWVADHGPMVVAYSGINGTYQWNRPHFLDFLSSIQQK